ncbi:MAG: hypothetical protein AAFV38_07270, partial [Pseudomonadota bacterium]
SCCGRCVGVTGQFIFFARRQEANATFLATEPAGERDQMQRRRRFGREERGIGFLPSREEYKLAGDPDTTPTA